MVRVFPVAAACACCAAIAAPAADRADADVNFSAKLGYDRTVGKYDLKRDTTVSTSSVTLDWDGDNYAFDVVLPYLKQSGPGRIITIAGRRPVIVAGPDTKASGRGDATLGLTRYLLNEEDDGFDLDLQGTYKLSTASAAKGLGSGKEDLSLQSALGRTFGRWTTTLTLGYTFVGKEAALGLRNAAFGSFDLSANVFSWLSVGATYSAGGTIVKGTPGSRDGTVYLTLKPAKGTRIEIYYLAGWSTQSPDRGGGVNVGWEF